MKRALLHLLIAACLWTSSMESGPAWARPARITTPPPGSQLRTQILDALRSSDFPDIRFIVHVLHVAQGKGSVLAFASVEPSHGGSDGQFGDFILENRRGWHVIWGITAGGSNSCARLAAHYASAIRLLVAQGVDPDALYPGLMSNYRREEAGARDPNCNDVGDI
ncbi:MULTISPECIES: hypothetical protein [unclassified Novosphingobium]|uniref:hypothetical protein n=1 Tax=unclassified Novosphingobium TaxID=2644732 RepID=UPI00146D7C77|nr:MULTISPECIES: hypothetical protein [unclassified Novosphingobium]NMN03900.1 hypothetical protein [Novosphingobium sp. SG919]NMN86110.1 hypothetical protein [Novosphingobium sp. SG916]